MPRPEHFFRLELLRPTAVRGAVARAIRSPTVRRPAGRLIRGGLSVHLSEAGTQTSLCGREMTRLEIQVPFETNGCKRCAAPALAAGTDYVVDVTGERLDLNGWRPFKEG